MTERNELWLRGGARRLQDEGGRARIRLSVDRGGVADLHGDFESKLTVSDRSGLDDGKPSPLSGLASFRGTALRYEKSVQAQHVETLIDLRRGQPWVKRNRDAAAGHCHDGEKRLRAVRHEHPDAGVAIKPSQTQLPADVVQLELKTVVCQRRERGGDDRRLVWEPTGSPTDDLAQRELGFRRCATAGGRGFLGADHASRPPFSMSKFPSLSG
jgi:hypothetical protein